MNLRLVVPPLLVGLVAAGIWAATREGAAPPPAGPGSGRQPEARNIPGDISPGDALAEKKWHPEPVRTAEVPRTEKIPAVVKAPKAVELRTRVRHSPVKEVRKRVGEVAKKGEVVIVLQPHAWTKELAAAEKAGDAARVAAAKEALASLEIRAEEEGIVHRIDASIGEMPLFHNDVCLPLAYLFDWTKLAWEGTAPASLVPSLGEGLRVMVASGRDPPVAALVEKRGAPDEEGRVALVVRPAAAPPGVPEPGGEATIQVVTGTREVLVVPRIAVRTERGRSFVDVVTVEGKLEPREVVVGSTAPEGRVEVSGVRKNESVAVWE